MFRWRSKHEGFEWHKYVRTTIKLRRDARRERVHRLKQSAIDGARAAGDAAGAAAKQSAQVAGAAACAVAVDGARHFVSGAKAAGSVARAMARVGAHRLARGSATAAIALARSLKAAAGYLMQFSALALAAILGGLMRMARSDAVAPLLDLLGRPGVSGPLAIAGGISLFAGVGRIVIGQFVDRDAGIAMLLGLVLLALAYGPRAILGTASPLPRWLAGINPTARRAGALTALGALAIAIGWSFLGERIALPGVSQIAGLSLAGTRTIEGRGIALAGDLLRVSGMVVRLDGIEAPEPSQRCQRSRHRYWRCAEAARDALARLTRARPIKCEVRGTDTVGRLRAACFDGDTDIGAALVRGGHVFAEQSLWSKYAGLEAEAQAAKKGVWGGEAERPGEFRARAWEEAKRSAPQGCPIKGQVSGGAKLYLLPWSPDYARVRVSKSRGDRWFCSEEEAIAAGWRPTERG